VVYAERGQRFLLEDAMRRVPLKGWVIILILVAIWNLLFYAPILTSAQPPPTVTLPYSAFVQQVEQGTVQKVMISGTTITGEFRQPVTLGAEGKPPRSYRYFSTEVPAVSDRLLALLEQENVEITVHNPEPPLWLQALGVLANILPLLFLLGLFGLSAYQVRQAQGGLGNVFGFGKSRARVYTEERPRVTFADVAGCEEAKQELQEVIAFLRDPQRFHRIGARIPRGVLLSGPPGTGKTLLARAVAGEAGVPFFSISATEFVEMFVGVGASRVRDLFQQAKAKAPCIIFIDEIDAVGRARGGGFGAVNDEREQTLNQLLVEMDGFETNQDVIVLAATNRPDVLDPALLRPGRFDRQVTVDRPDRRGREAILRLHTRGKPIAPDVRLDLIAQETPGLAGADLANLVNEAALAAARAGKSEIGQDEFAEAIDKVLLGVRRGILIDPEERRGVAYHEAGHAIVAAFTPGADPIQKVSIIPRGRALGITQLVPMDDKHNYTRSYLLGRLAIMLGGRAAEEIALGEVTTGAENDLKEVRRLARKMVTEWAMVPGLPPSALEDSDAPAFATRPWPGEGREHSEQTARMIDEAIASLVGEAYQRARQILLARRAQLDALAEALLREETIEGEEIRRLLGEAVTAEANPDGRVTAPDLADLPRASSGSPWSGGEA
jgi:cell division protease FtsH